MPIKLIHVSDIHFGSGESHGRLNPESGLNVRLEDLVRALVRVVDFSLENKADMFLFCGDAYKNPAPEPVYQQFFARQLKRLSDAKIPVVLLVGNHDLIMKPGASHSLSVFQSLEVPRVTVIEKPQLIKMKTRHGKLQLIGMPHVTRHLLMTHKKYAGYSASEIDRVLAGHTGSILKDFYSELDENIPTVTAAHLMIDSARGGAEKELMVNYSASFPLDIFLDSRVDYVALGHVHSRQILHEKNPLVAYAGSLERVDFSEEKEDKGFIEINIERKNVSYLFHSINPRPFITVEAELSQSENPTADLLQIARYRVKEGAVVRIKYRIQQSRLGEIDEEFIRASLPQLLSLRFKPELIYTERPRRMPDINERAVLQPLVALDKYLSDSGVQNKDELILRASRLMTRKDEQDKS